MMVEDRATAVEERHESESYPIEQAPERKRGLRGLTPAILLIGAGVVLLLSNLGMLPPIDWFSLLNYWPILLILIGLEIMLGNRSILGSIAVALLGLVVLGGVIFFVGIQQAGVAGGSSVTYTIAEDLGSAKTLDVTLNLGITDTQISGASDNSLAVQGQYTTNKEFQVQTIYDVRGDTGYLTISHDSSSRFPSIALMGDLSLGLTNAVPMSLHINGGVGNAVLDLTGIQLSSLDINTGVGNLEVILPAEGRYEVTVNGGVGNIEITVPAGLSVLLSVDEGIADVDVSLDNVSEVSESRWESEDYSSAQNRVEMSISSGIGDITIGD